MLIFDEIDIILLFKFTCLHRLAYRNTGNDTGSLDTNTETCLGGDRSFTVDGITQSVDDTPQKFFAHGYVYDSAGTLDDVSFFDIFVVTEYYNTYIVGFQIQGHTLKIEMKN